VHSFTGSGEEAQQLLELHPKIFIGINGCSLKTEDNCAAMASVPLQRLMIETDAPWCDLRATHASAKYVETRREALDRKKHRRDRLVKARNEPCNIDQVCTSMLVKYSCWTDCTTGHQM
jgi:TatD DNase family protein